MADDMMGDDTEMPGEESSTKRKTWIDAEEVAGYNCEPGDILKFRVVGKDKDGDVEVEMIGEEKGGGDKNWKDDLANSMPKSMGGNSQDEESYV